jgi:hypothetical protein
MNRARFLAGAAVLAAACALPNAAHAIISPCMVLGSPMPPPCIVIDASKIVQHAAELKTKTEELQNIVQQAKEMTDIQGALGKVKGAVKAPLAGVTPIAPIAMITPGEASSQLVASLPAPDGSMAGSGTYGAAVQKANRAAAGDGWAIAETTKDRLIQLDLRARTIQAVAICAARKPAQAGDAGLRTDWQVNTRAKSLVMQTIATLKEVQAARLSEKSVKAFEKPTVGSGKTLPRAEAPAPSIPKSEEWAPKLGAIAGLSNKLSALMLAGSLYMAYKEAIAGHQQTQTDYQSILKAAQNSEAQLQNLAASDARRKGVSAASLLSTANQYMSRDRTAWDDPSKADVAKSLADAAKKQLDRMVSGDVSGQWSQLLQNRAEAYKQEAFFRPISEQANALEKDTMASLAQYEASIGMKVSDLNAINAEIAKTQQELGAIGNSMSNAPADVIRQRDAIYKSTVDGAAQAQAVMQGAEAAANMPDA